MYELERSNIVWKDQHWRRYFGERYLDVQSFCRFCESVGLARVDEHELERLELEGLFFPAARTILPYVFAKEQMLSRLARRQMRDVMVREEDLPIVELERCLRFAWPREGAFEWDSALHPVDVAWGIRGLLRPTQTTARPWREWDGTIDFNDHTYRLERARAYYSHWQVYQLHGARRFARSASRDGRTAAVAGWVRERLHKVAQVMDAVSYYESIQHWYRARLFDEVPENNDGWRVLDSAQAQRLEEYTGEALFRAICTCNLSEEELVSGIREMSRLHRDYIGMEKVRLAGTMREEIGRALEVLMLATGAGPDDAIRRIEGDHGPHLGYLRILFPDARKQRRADAYQVLRDVAVEYNSRAGHYQCDEDGIERLLLFLERSELEFVMYAVASVFEEPELDGGWHLIEAFERLRTLAASLETVGREIVRRGPRTGSTKDLESILRTIIREGHQPVWRAHVNAGDRTARTTEEFNRRCAETLVATRAAGTEAEYVGRTLAVGTLARNFTSHHIADSWDLFAGNYRPCAAGIVRGILAIWVIACTRWPQLVG